MTRTVRLVVEVCFHELIEPPCRVSASLACRHPRPAPPAPAAPGIWSRIIARCGHSSSRKLTRCLTPSIAATIVPCRRSWVISCFRRFCTRRSRTTAARFALPTWSAASRRKWCGGHPAMSSARAQVNGFRARGAATGSRRSRRRIRRRAAGPTMRLGECARSAAMPALLPGALQRLGAKLPARAQLDGEASRIARASFGELGDGAYRQGTSCAAAGCFVRAVPAGASDGCERGSQFACGQSAICRALPSTGTGATMSEPQEYVLGHSDSAARRLEIQDAHFAEVSELLLNELALRPGDRVVELGCGAGSFSRRVLRRLGAGGVLVAVDSSDGLLTQARAATAGVGAARFEPVRADIAELGHVGSTGRTRWWRGRCCTTCRWSSLCSAGSAHGCGPARASACSSPIFVRRSRASPTSKRRSGRSWSPCACGPSPSTSCTSPAEYRRPWARRWHAPWSWRAIAEQCEHWMEMAARCSGQSKTCSCFSMRSKDRLVASTSR